MRRTIFKSKIHMAKLTETELDYTGSITIPRDIMEAADLLAGERVQITVRENGSRLETYVIPGKAGDGNICLNGPAARLAMAGDTIVIISYAIMEDEEARNYSPKILIMDENNKIKEQISS